MSTLCLVNGRIVNEGRIRELDLLIVGERIERIGPGPVPPRTRTIDLGGRHVLPGLIDDQVHFREPGLTHKASIGSESRAAICGGVTSFLDMPNNLPPCVSRDGLELKRRIARASSFANYGFYLGATNTNIEEIRRASARDACGIKVFMGASTGNMLVDDERALAAIFADAGLPIVTHCEDSPMIWAAERQARERYGDDVPMSEHPRIRSAEACFKSSSLAVALATQHGARLHVLHLTTARELALFERGPVSDKRVTVEVCAHHLWFDASDYERLGTRIKCNPAIKTGADRAALVEAVQSDVVDVIATDHAPHTLAEKSRGYFEAPSGLPLVQHLLPMLLEQHRQGLFSLERIVEKTAHNPARLFGIRDRGFLREGCFADLAIVDLDCPSVVASDTIRYKCAWSPLEGTVFGATIVMTVLNGAVVAERGEALPGRHGRALEFGAWS